jgi:hypothetical protein
MALLALLVSFSKASGQREPLTLPPEARQALAALGSDNFAERKTAIAVLGKMAPSDSLELELFKLSRSTDSEVCKHAESILRVRLNNRANSAVCELNDTVIVKRLLKERGIDVYAEWLSLAGVKASNDQWAVLQALIDDSLIPEMKKRLLNPKLQGVRLDAYKNAKPVDEKDFFNARPNAQPRRYRLCCDSLIKPETLSASIVVSRGPVQSIQANGCLIVALGPVKIGDMSHCVVICDENVSVSRCMTSVIISTEQIEVQRPLDTEEWRISDAREKFNPIRFSSLKDVGIELKEMEKKWVVSALKEDSPFAGSQVKVGDVILAADAVPINEPNTLRRAIRKASFSGKLFLTVERSGTVTDLIVKMPLLPK